MTDRAQPGARGSTNRNLEFGETASPYSDGFIFPSDDPSLSSQRYGDIDESQFEEFNAYYSNGSLTVTISPGEGHVNGWVARDSETDIDLAPSTDGQTVVLGWDPDAVYVESEHATRDDADRVIVDLESNIDPTYPTVPIWEFDTDGSGVTLATDRRTIGPAAHLKHMDAEEAVVDELIFRDTADGN